MNRLYIIILAFLCSMTLSHAQTVLTGTVRDTKGVPVIGAAVTIDTEASAGAVTDMDGRYSLNLRSEPSPKAVLIVSCLSYETQNVPLNGRATVDVVLNEDTELLEEVVVVGYGSMRRSDLTGSVSSVRLDDDAASTSASLDQLLQGNAAGVSVVSSSAAPDAAVSVRVRGVTSLNGSNEPLYVIDGVIMTNADTPQMFTQGADNSGSDEDVNALMGINPQDIASMEILKDASATAIYGSAGANGVVLITTKSADKDKPVIRANVGIDVATRYKTIDMLDFDVYVDYLEAKGMPLGSIYEDTENRTGLKVSPIDWQDYMMQTTVNQRYYLSISGRPKTLNYQFSVGYNKRDGIIRNTGSDQFTIRMNVTKNLFRNFKIGTKTSLAYIDSRMTQGASSTRLNASSSLMRSMMISRPYTSLTGEDIEEELDDEYRGTPMKWVKDFRNTRQEYRITPHLFAEWKILRWLEFKTSVGGDFRLSERMKWKGASVNSGSEGSIAAASDVMAYNWNIDNTLNFNKKYRKHRISGTLGMTTTRSVTKVNVVEGWNIVEDSIQDRNINSAKNSRFSYTETAFSMNSYFARALYNYDDRYLVTATCRVDGSSKFSKANRYSVFPSFALAWRLSEEKWFKADFISSAKIRAGWGQVGNSGVSPYQIFSTYRSGSYADHTSSNMAEYLVGIMPDNIANPDLKWETTRQANVGLDLAFFKGRISLSADLYDKNTYDLLQKKKIPASSGFQTIWVNDGSILNRGLELTLETVPVSVGDFEWTLNGNVSFNRNRMTSLGYETDRGEIYLTPDDRRECSYFLGSNVGSGDYLNSPANIFIEGQPIGLFYGYRTDGIVPEGGSGTALTEGGAPAAQGSISYMDLNGNGWLDPDDRTIIGDPNPDFTYGLSTSFTWRDLSLSVACNGSYGNDIVNANLIQETETVNLRTGNIRREAYENAWTTKNQNTIYPAVGVTDPSEVKLLTDRIIEDGSFLRISNVALSYRLPLPENKVVRSIVLGLSAKNCFVWTKYSGWDPEVNSFGKDMTKIGIDCGSYPSARTFCLDLKFTF